MVTPQQTSTTINYFYTIFGGGDKFQKCDSAVAEHSTHYSKMVGLNTAVGTGRGKMALVCLFFIFWKNSFMTINTKMIKIKIETKN